MASANGTDTWSRDPVADANPELPRKRERLSEEAETSPLSADDAVLVEALSPEDPGTSYASAIEVHDDALMAPLSASFTLQDGVEMTPVDQLHFVCDQFERNILQERTHVDSLAQWVNQHAAMTDVSWHDAYQDELEFFGLLGKYCFRILDCPDEVFETGSVSSQALDHTGDLMFNFHHSVTLLSFRMIEIIPQVIDRTITRRDSGQVPKSKQRIDLLYFVQIVAQTTALHRASGMSFMKDILHLRPKAMTKERRLHFLRRETAATSLIAVLGKLAHHQSEIANAWDAIDAALHVVSNLDLGAQKSAELTMDSAHMYILPVVCAKHPRALPDGFHELLIRVVESVLSQLVKESTMQDVAALYDRYIKTDHDALLAEVNAHEEVEKLLQDMSHNDRGILIQLMTTAWILQALRAFIYSDIMDVRSSGISMLSSRLLELYNAYRTSKEGFDHPVLQYVARFMRTNELTKYIFGPNSHASLVSHSQNIIGFLAVTLAYTDLETDIIWHACTNSVEAEFVKASFGVLGDLSRYLDLDHLLYLANKYAITPPSKLGKDAVDTLTDLFAKVQIKSGEVSDQRHRLATAFISIDIMMKADEVEDSQSLSRLREIARTELFRFTDRLYSTDDRLQIYLRCIPNIINATQHSTTSSDIVLMFLRAPSMSSYESQELLAKLPVESAIDELARYVESCHNKLRDQFHSAMPAIPIRIEVTIRLMALAGGLPGEEAMSKFCRHAVGDLALDNQARDCAWNLLTSLTHSPDISNLASTILRSLLSGEFTPLPITLVTPQLVKLFGMSLRNEAQSKDLHDRFSLILDTSMWQKLVEIAESTVIPSVHRLAIETICDLLFDFPQQLAGHSAVVQCHADFARQQIARICSNSAPFTNCDESSICQKVGVLDAVLTKSRQYSAVYHPDKGSKITLATDPKEGLLQYRLQLYGNGYAQPRSFQVQASNFTTLSQFAAHLPSITGATDNRVIIGGKLIDLRKDSERLLSEVGLQPSAVILLCPKHTANSNLDVVSLASGAVELEILAHFDELEKLLDGPNLIANKIYLFLRNVRPPTHTRLRIVSGDTPIDDICPPKGIWRTCFTFDVLQTHLTDFARLGVADENFLRRGVQLLVSFLIDEARAIHPEISYRALRSLVAFLQGSSSWLKPLYDGLGTNCVAELPERAITLGLIEQTNQFTRRMIDLCFFALQLSTEHPYRRSLIDHIFKALLQAFRRQHSVWQDFADDPRAIELHAQVLFDDDLVVSTNVAETIKAFSTDPTAAEDIADFYLKMALSLLPQALAHTDTATHFFDLATDVMFANRLLRANEARVREIVSSLISSLWSYNHTESVDFAVSDMAVSGLLRLLTEAINILKSFKKPLQLHDFALHLLSQLLFPAYKTFTSKPLINQQSRRLAYRLAQITCESDADITGVLEQLSEILQDADDNPLAKYPGLSGWLRPASKCSGLPNLGMTCYMNSLLQQLYANVHFRKFIFDTPVYDESKQSLLDEVQRLFAFMQDACTLVPETSGLAKVLGIQTDSQEDVHGFYEDFLSRLESNMPDDLSKKTLATFFTGKMIQQIKGECGHISPQTEPFVDLPVVVRNKSCLSESLDEYVQGEPMEGANRYKCQACQTENGGKLVNAMKRSCPEETPDNLTFCLKRFTYESMVGVEGKVNDRFEFPQKIDMSQYHRTYLEDSSVKNNEDWYELVGVIVHQGTLHLGHYWSYTLLRNTANPLSRNWVKLEDRNVTFISGGIEEVQRESFGGLRYSNGNERADNAYVLFYQRQRKLQELISLPGPTVDPSSLSALPPRVAVPPSLGAMIHDQNAWRHRIAHLFDDDFHDFVNWSIEMVDHYAPFVSSTRSAEQPEVESQSTNGTLADEDPEQGKVALFSKVATSYLQRIAVCDCRPAKRTRECLERYVPHIEDQPLVAQHTLQRLLENPEWLVKVVQHEHHNVRSHVSSMFVKCLKLLRRHKYPLYLDKFRNIVSLHSAAFKKFTPQSFDWITYLSTAQDLAQLGAEETATILDEGYWTWAFEMLRVPYDAGVRKRYQGIHEYVKVQPAKISAAYDFLSGLLLTGHVEARANSERSRDGEPHVVNSSLVLLSHSELHELVRSSEFSNYRNICFWMRTSRYALKDCDWADSAPGKLLAILTSSKVPLPIMRTVEDSLLRHIEVEEESLTAIIHLVMHFCASCASDHDAATAQPVFFALVRVLNQWDGSDKEFAKVIEDAYQMIPQVVLASMEMWVMACLTSRQVFVREDIAKWLELYVFKSDEPLTGPPDLDVTRLHHARKVANLCSETLQNAYESRKARSRYEAGICVALAIERYLRALIETVRAIEVSEDAEEQARIAPGLQVELGEAQATINELGRLELDCIMQWEPESALPGTLQEARRSVELASDEADSEEWEEEEEEEDVL